MLLYSDKMDIQQEVDEKKKNMANIQDEILFSKKTEWDCHLQKTVVHTGDHYVKTNKPNPDK